MTASLTLALAVRTLWHWARVPDAETALLWSQAVIEASDVEGLQLSNLVS
jgi:hypothetical protein